MKYGAARFVYGLAAVFLIITGVNTALVSFIENRPSGLKDIVSFAFAMSIFAVAFPLGLGYLCLFRYRYWHRKAIQMKTKRFTDEKICSHLPRCEHMVQGDP